MNNLKDNSNYVLFFTFIMFVIFISACEISSGRDISVGTDTAQYISIFNRINENYSHWFSRYEPILLCVMYFTKFLDLSFEWFSRFNFIIVYLLSILTLKNFVSSKISFSSIFLVFLSFSAVFNFSDWYFTAVTNGLRQGLSLVILFYSFSLYFKRKFKGFIIFALLSFLAHYSSLLFILSFLLSLPFSYKNLLLVFVFFVPVYILNLGDVFFDVLSSYLGISTSIVIGYLEGETKWSGFNLSFFIYSIFYFFVFLFLNKYTNNNKYHSVSIFLHRVYISLLLPFFFFGFMPFSNRFAFASWLFSALALSAFIIFSRLKFVDKIAFCFFLYVVSFVIYINKYFF